MQESFKKHMLVFVLTVAVILLASATVNVVVDPFGMYRLVELEGFNDSKPAIYHRVRLLKAYEVRRIKPQSIVLGTSRVHLGMRPSHEGWASQYDPRYNLGFDGATTTEMYAYLIHAHKAGNLEHVILGLDSYHLTNAPATARPDFDSTLLYTEQDWINPFRMAAADFKILTSISTLQASLNTVRAEPEPRWLAPDGQRLGNVFFYRPGENYVECGPRCYFDEIDKLEVRYKLEWKIPVDENKPLRVAPEPSTDPVTSMDYIRKIMAYCVNNDIKLVIFLTPSHAHQLELDGLTGNWSSVKNGKREIVKLAAEYDESIPVYDFTRYSSITTEALPPEGTQEEMRYYWDSSHFKQLAGDMVLDVILGTNSTGGAIPGDFGIRMRPDNVETSISRLNETRQSYQIHAVSELEKLEDWVDNFMEKHGIKDE